MAKSPVIVGAQAVAYVNGRMWANVKSFRFKTQALHKEQMGLDSLLPVELIPVRYGVSGSMSLYRLNGDGGLEGQGAIASADDLLLEKYVTFSLVNRLTDEILFRTDQLKFESQDWSVSAKGIMEGTASFKAINCRTSSPF